MGVLEYSNKYDEAVRENFHYKMEIMDLRARLGCLGPRVEKCVQVNMPTPPTVATADACSQTDDTAYAAGCGDPSACTVATQEVTGGISEASFRTVDLEATKCSRCDVLAQNVKTMEDRLESMQETFLKHTRDMRV
jgi:hypothetical protein